MSNSIDQRIVEMKFDNSSFERGVASTMASLNSLDKVLGGSKGFQALKNVADNIDTSVAESNISNMGRAFDVVADRAEGAFSRIGNLMSNLGKGFGIVTGLINTGIAGIAIQGGISRAMNISDAQFKLKQLGQSWEEVYPILDKSVADTAYGLDEAAVAAAMLSASGVTAQNGLEETLKATANLASVSGIEYSRVAQIMGQVASNGKLMQRQLESFEVAGINVVGILAQQWGLAEEEINTMIRKGEIDLKMFRDAMNTYLGDGAKEAQNTFSGSLTNVRAALSKLTDDFFLDSMNSMIPVFQALRPMIKSVEAALDPLIGSIEHGGVVTKGFRDVMAGVAEAFNDWAKESNGPERLAVFFKELSAGLEGFFTAVAGGAKDFTYAMLDIMGIVRELVRIFGELVSPFFMALNDVFGGNTLASGMAGFRGGLEDVLGVLQGFSVGAGYVKILRSAFVILFSVIKSLGSVAFSILGAGVKVFSALIDLGLQGFNFLFDLISNIVTALSDLLGIGFGALGDFFQPFLDMAAQSPVLQAIGDVFGVIGESIEAFFKIVKGEAEPLDGFTDAIGKLSGANASLLTALGDAFADLGSKLSSFGAGFRDSALDIAGKVMARFQQIAEKLQPVISAVAEHVAGAWNVITTAFANAGFSFDPFLELFSSVGEAFSTFMDALLTGDSFSFDNFAALFEGLKDAFGTFLGDIGEPLGSFLAEIGESIYSSLDGPLKSLLDWVLAIQNPLDGIIGRLQELSDSITGGLSNFKLPWDKTGEDAAAGADGVVQAVNKAYDAISGFDMLIAALRHPLKTTANILSSALNEIAEALNVFVENMSTDAITKFLKTFAQFAALGAIFKGFLDLSKLFSAVTGLVEGAGKLLKSIVGLGESLKSSLDSLSSAFKTQAVLNIAIGVGILVAALIALTMIDQGKIGPAIASLLVLVGALGALAIAFGKLDLDGDNIAKASTAMLKIAAAVAIMGLIAALLGSMDVSAFGRGMAAIIIFGGIMAAVVKLSAQSMFMEELGDSLIKMAAAITIMGVIAKLLGEMDPGALVRGVVSVGLIMAALVVFSSAMNKFGGGEITGATALLELVSAIAVLGLVIALLSTLDPASALVSAGLVVGLLAALYLVMKGITKLSEGAGNIIAGASAVLVLAAAVAVLAASMAVLSQLDLASLVASAITVGLLMAELAAIAILMTKFAESSVGLAAAAGAVVVMSAAMLIISGSIAILAATISMTDWGSVLLSAVIIASIMAIMAVVIIAMSNLSGQAAVAAGSMVAVALAIAVLAAIVVAFSTMDFAAAGMGLLLLAGVVLVAVVAFAALAAIAEGFALGVVLVIGVLLAIAAAAVAFGFAVSMIASAIDTAINAFIRFGTEGPAAAEGIVQALVTLAQGLWDSKETLALGIMAIGIAIVTAIIGLIPAISAAVVQLLVGILTAFLGAIPVLAQGLLMGVINLINSLADGIRTMGPLLLDALLNLGMAILEGLLGILGAAGDALMNFLNSVTGGLVPASSNSGQQIIDAFGQGAQSSTAPENAAQQKTQSLNDILRNNAAGSGAFGTDFMNNLGAGMQSVDVKSMLQSSLGGMPDVSAQIGGETVDSFNGSATGFELTGVEDVESMLQELPQISGEAGSQTSQAFNENCTISGDEMAASLDTSPIVAKVGEAGAESATAFNDSFGGSISLDSGGAISSAAADLGQTGQFADAGTSAGNAYSESFDSALSSVPDTASSAASNAVSSFEGGGAGGYSAGFNVGNNISSGLAAGLWAGYGSVAAAAAAIVSAAEEAMRAKAEIASPSKMAIRIGDYIAQGVGVGIENRETYVSRIAGGFVTSVLRSMQDVGYLDGLLGDIDENPVIRPVLDLDEYASGIAQMTSMMPTDQLMNAGRIMGYGAISSPFSNATNNNAHYEINLNYTNDADANKMFEDLTRELHSKNLMEAH